MQHMRLSTPGIRLHQSHHAELVAWAPSISFSFMQRQASWTDSTTASQWLVQCDQHWSLVKAADVFSWSVSAVPLCRDDDADDTGVASLKRTDAAIETRGRRLPLVEYDIRVLRAAGAAALAVADRPADFDNLPAAELCSVCTVFSAQHTGWLKKVSHYHESLLNRIIPSIIARFFINFDDNLSTRI